MTFLGRVLTVVEDPESAKATCDTLVDHLDLLDQVTALYVVDQDRSEVPRVTIPSFLEEANRALSVVETELEGETSVETRTVFDPNVRSAVDDAALDSNADTIVIRPKTGGSLEEHLAGGGDEVLVTNPSLPTIVFPRPE